MPLLNILYYECTLCWHAGKHRLLVMPTVAFADWFQLTKNHNGMVSLMLYYLLWDITKPLRFVMNDLVSFHAIGIYRPCVHLIICNDYILSININ